MSQPRELNTSEALIEATDEAFTQASSFERPSRLMNRNFVLLWQGQAVSQLGSYVNSIAIVFLIKHATESATLIGLMRVLSSIPGVIVSVIAGTFADRFSRRKIIIYSDLVRGVAILSLAALLYTLPDATEITLVWIFVIAVCMSVAGSFFGPSIAAAMPDLVPEGKVAQANALRQVTGQLALFLGQGLGGILYRVLGAPLLTLVNGLSYFFSAVTQCFIKIPQNIPEKRGSWREEFDGFKGDTVAGFRYVRKRTGLKYLFYVSALSNFFMMPIIMLFPFYVEDFLKVKMDWYGYLLAVYGAGIFLGSICAGFIKLAGATRAALIITSAACASITAGMLGFTHSPVIAITMIFMVGIMGGFNGINLVTILQTSTPSAVRGRVFGLLNTLTGSMAPIGMGLGGIAFDLTGQNIPLIYGSCGGIMAVLSMTVAFNRDFRNLLAYGVVEENN